MAIEEKERKILLNFWETHKELLLAAMDSLVEIIEDDEEKEIMRKATKVAAKNYDKYTFGDKTNLSKRELALAIIRTYLEINPQTTYLELKEKFPDNLAEGALGVFTEKATAEERAKTGGQKLHFLGQNEILKTIDGKEIAVTNQWRIEKMPAFIANAAKYGFEIKVTKN